MSKTYGRPTGSNQRQAIRGFRVAAVVLLSVAATCCAAASTHVASASPTSISFGQVNVGASANATVTLTNTGTGTLILQGSSLSDSADFSATSWSTRSLLPGQTATLTLTFTPHAAASYAASLTVLSNASTEPTVSLTGTGVSSTTTPVGVTVSPSSASITDGQTQGLSATVSGTTTTGVAWSIAGIGSLSPSGNSATYTAPSSGTGTATVTATSVADPTKSASSTITVSSASSISVSITPTSATVQAGSGQTQAFTAAVSGTTTTGVTWSMSGIGSISYSGNTAVYTPPTTGSGTATVTATSVADPTKSASASVTVTAPSTSVSVSVSPSSATVQAFTSQQFTASVSGTTNTAVTWLVNGVVGGSSTTGSISPAGLYTAPACPSTSSVTITAQSVYDSTAKGNATAGLTSTTPSNYHFVATTGSDSNDGSGCHPWVTIQHAANVVNAGDTVFVGDGTYVETPNFTRGGTSSSRVTFRSLNKWGAKISPTITQLGNAGDIAVDVNAAYITVQDFDIAGVNPNTSNGSHGIKCQSNANNCNIIGNHVHDWGVDSTCPSGAAVQSAADNDMIVGNYINHNGPPSTTTFSCATMQAIYINGGNNGYIQNNLIIDCPMCAGIQFYGAAPNGWTITNNTLANIGGTQGDGAGYTISCYTTGATCGGNKFNNNILYNIGGFCLMEHGGGTFLNNNTYYNNLVYNCNGGMYWVNGSANYTGTVTSPPQFVNYTGTISGDYHLQSTSPAINTGTSSGAPSFDYDGYSRPYGGYYDIGGYEWHP